MKSEQPDPLDRLLRNWADQSAPDADHLQELQENIMQRWQIEQCPTIATPMPSPGERRHSAAILGFVAGALLMALVVIVWNGKPSQDRTEPTITSSEPPPKFAWLNDAELAEKTVLRDELIALFDQRFAWLAETAEGVEIGVEERDHATDSPSLAVRVVVEIRPADGSDWQTVWATDVVTRSEEVVEITPQTHDVQQFRLWAYALPDGMVWVDTGLTLAGETTELVAAEKLQRDGQAEVIYQTRHAQRDVRILQAAAVL